MIPSGVSRKPRYLVEESAHSHVSGLTVEPILPNLRITWFTELLRWRVSFKGAKSMETLILVIDLIPLLLCIISNILGRKYLGLFRSLLSFLKSLNNLTLSFLLKMMNIGNAHLLLGI